MAGKKRYQIKEAFYTLQGEGAHSGRPAVFCRFTGCNLWSGKEKHRATAVCQFVIRILSVRMVRMGDSSTALTPLPVIYMDSGPSLLKARSMWFVPVVSHCCSLIPH